MGAMPGTMRASNIGTMRGLQLTRTFGAEVRQARLSAGLSQQQVGAAVGVSHTQISRIELAQLQTLSFSLAARLAAILGLELAMVLRPTGSPMRDRAHLALIERLRVRLAPGLLWRTEVPMPGYRDLRALDALTGSDGWTAAIEAETRLHDGQSIERRARLKQRDIGATRLILLLLESRANRQALDLSPEMCARFPVSQRQALARLGRGQDPGGDALILL
jgi:transcriptional regulator with XRE-family HTH domain